jgi:hypothetical protein
MQGCKVIQGKEQRPNKNVRQREIVTKREGNGHPEIVLSQSFVTEKPSIVIGKKFKRREQRSSTGSSSPHLVPQLLQNLIMLTHSPKVRTGRHEGMGSATQSSEPLVSRALKFRTVCSRRCSDRSVLFIKMEVALAAQYTAASTICLPTICFFVLLMDDIL